MSNIDVTDVVAHIKQEFIIPVETQANKQEAAEARAEREDSTDEPPNKKQKLTGTHKKRPKLIKAPKSSKLCRSVWCLRVGEDVSGKCTFPKCDFMHDVAAFLSTKPEDLGSVCHNFRTYGMCHYGFTCRYGRDHIEDLGNKVNKEIWAKYEKSPTVSNVLQKEVQQELRKRQYDFTKALQAHRKAQSEVAKNNTTDKNKILDKMPDETPIEKSGATTEDQGGDEQSLLNGSQENADKSEKETVLLEVHKNGSDSEKVENNTCDGEEPQRDEGTVKHNTQAAEKEATHARDNNFLGPAPEEDLIKLNAREKKKIEWRGKTYLAPLTTLGNLPFRRICKQYGVDITCGEMALASCLLQGSPSEWALVKRHESEDLFGVQVCGSNAETMIKCAQLLDENTDVNFMDINMGCPIDLIYKQGGGSALMRRHGCLEHMVRGMTRVLSKPLTLKMRTAIYRDTQVAHKIIEKAKLWDVSMVTLHGRSKEQRYLKVADWDYITECAEVADPMPLFGNGDVLSFEDYNYHREHSKVAGMMIGRGALIKPWIFKEIKEQQHWDISSSERFDMLKDYVNYGMEHWGSDTEGIEKTRRFLLEWLSFLHRYIPVGLLEQTQKINQRPLAYRGRNDLETLMASRSVSDWIKISEMLLGPTPSDFVFLPKHKANAY
ncbi:tRNA-dihydrouridine(47) synthase [NAD(P)(+)]-like [Procambarus clarkii]|uniref:tRNA-dihydrouridine(47) synthase [NAD(P)(+)]-like n=1 Tax=Procambarus clarkii TaxID=6728 RepID=UPI0037436860